MSGMYVLVFDQGTTSTRAVVYDEHGQAVGWQQRRHISIYPRPGWVSQDARAIFDNVVETGRAAISHAGIAPASVAAVGITNQRETIVLWDRRTGAPVADAIVWQCRRTAPLCEQMIRDGWTDTVRQKTGLFIDPYFSATKIKWLLDHVPEARALMRDGFLRAGTIDSYILWRLTNGQRHVTDFTNAARTMLFDITKLCWDPALMAYFGIDPGILPTVVPSSGHGVSPILCNPAYFGAALPVTGIAGDQHAALFGQACFEPGDVKNTYGTGCFIVKHIGPTPPPTENRLLTTIAWYKDGQPAYALEGSVFSAGAAVEWLIREAALADSVEAVNEICAETPDTGGVYFVPAFTGLGAPYWDPYARGTLCGLSLATGRRHIVRALMESIAFQSRDVIDHMNQAYPSPPRPLRVDGGVSKSDFLMQFQADLLQTPVERAADPETTALGVYYMAGLGADLFDLAGVKARRVVERVFMPTPCADKDVRYAAWQEAVRRAQHWAG